MRQKSDSNAKSSTPAAPAAKGARVEFRTVPYARLLPPPEPMRAAMDDAKLLELADSIQQFGIMQPLITTPQGDKLEIIAGHRRYVAAGIAGLPEIPVGIWPTVTDAKYGMMLHENIMREDVTAAEEGQQFLELADRHGWSMEQLTKFFRRSENYINDRACMVRDFPDLVEPLNRRLITFAQAKAIAREKKPERRTYLLDQAIHSGANATNIGVMVNSFAQQDRLQAMGPGVAIGNGDGFIVPCEMPRCIWCDRDDDQSNMTLVSVHLYHKRDLLALLEQLAARPTRQGSES